MAHPSLPSVVHFLRVCLGGAEAQALTDEQLLQRFAKSHDETAFETLLRRHGPLVWSG